MTIVDSRAVTVKIFLMVVIAYHRYSNELERADEDIYDDFKLITRAHSIIARRRIMIEKVKTNVIT